MYQFSDTYLTDIFPFNSETSEQTVLTENLRSILTQVEMSIPFWLNSNESWYFVVTVFLWFFSICDKNDNEAKFYSTWRCKEANSDFSIRKGHLSFYCNCKLSYLFYSTLSQLDRHRMFFVLFTKKKDNQSIWQTFFSSFEMEVFEESNFNPNIFKGTYKFVLSTKIYLKYPCNFFSNKV